MTVEHQPELPQPPSGSADGQYVRLLFGILRDDIRELTSWQEKHADAHQEAALVASGRAGQWKFARDVVVFVRREYRPLGLIVILLAPSWLAGFIDGLHALGIIR